MESAMASKSPTPKPGRQPCSLSKPAAMDGWSTGRERCLIPCIEATHHELRMLFASTPPQGSSLAPQWPLPRSFAIRAKRVLEKVRAPAAL